MLLKKGFKFRLDPTQGQWELCAQFAGASRFLYNRGLEQRKAIYEAEGRSMTYFAQNNELVSLKRQEATSWLQLIHSQVLQQALKNLDTAFQNFFQNVKSGKKPGFPRFKCKGLRDSFRYPQGVKVDGTSVYLPKIGWVRFRKSREIEGAIKQTTICREGDHWYVAFSTEQEVPTPAFAPINEDKAVGIDVGIKHFATMASGSAHIPTYVSNPRFFTKHLPRLRVLARRLSKKVKFGKNWLKAKKQLSKLYARIKRCREDFAHKLSTEIVKNHDIICVEGLDIANLLEKSARPLSRAIADASWRSFLRCLQYKAKERGKHFVETGRFFPSTQICSACGANQKIGLEEREYRCPSCAMSMDRDLNSAIVEKAAGMSVLKACGATP
ncbi:MAG: transposase [Verrucomicrobia bacterium]|nr:transposase [Verrucomicrobiota bacterium]